MERLKIGKKGLALTLSGTVIAVAVIAGQMFYADSTVSASASLNSTGGINADGTIWGATFDADMDNDGAVDVRIDTADIYRLQNEIDQLNKSIKAYNP